MREHVAGQPAAGSIWALHPRVPRGNGIRERLLGPATFRDITGTTARTEGETARCWRRHHGHGRDAAATAAPVTGFHQRGARDGIGASRRERLASMPR